MKSSADDEIGGRHVDAGGLRLYINDIGTGYPVICLHGGGPGASGWSNFKQNVAAISARYRMILIDMPNFGRSQMTATPEGRLTHCANAIRALMDVLGIRRAHFIGNSMGAQSIIKFAIDSPDRIDRLVALGNNAFQHGFFMPRPAEGIKMIADYYRGEGPTRQKMKALIQTLVYDSSFLTDAIVEERYQASAIPEAVALWSKSPPKSEDISHLLAGVRCPTLFVWGAEDRFSSLDSGLTMVKLFKDAEMHIFPRCGHWAQVERADDFNALALDFFARKS